MWLVELVFFMNNEKTGHYRAIMSGFCCFDCYKAQPTICSPSKLFTYIFLPVLNQVLTYIYSFLCLTFVNYWRLPLSTKVENVDREYDHEMCHRCKQHDHSKPKSRICVFCDTKFEENGQKTVLGDGKAEDEERQLLAEVESHALCVTATSKLVTASSENSFMPLLQMALLFPRYFFLLVFSTFFKNFDFIFILREKLHVNVLQKSVEVH